MMIETPPESMLPRFQGDQGRRRVIELLQTQLIIGGDTAIAGEIADVAEIRELFPNDVLIRQGSADNDFFFVLSGGLRVFVNGREVAVRQAGQHIGEMAIIDPSSRRTASVIASEPCIIVRIDESAFLSIADRNPRIWHALALELSRRLDERKKFHQTPNDKPILFIGSSSEQLPIAEAIAAAIPDDITSVTLWSQGVFGASSFPVDDLEMQVGIADFALLVAGPDDQVSSRGNLTDAPRDNVIFELGLFIGALSRSRTFLLVPKGLKVKIPTDLLGLTCIQFDPDKTTVDESVQSVVEELIAVITTKGSK
jgi:CRP/FNR family transcriptional regulator, cyclic AMP receptor protein